MARIEIMKLHVATRSTTNEKPIAAVIPVTADLKKALSDSIQPQNTVAVYVADCSCFGAVNL